VGRDVTGLGGLSIVVLLIAATVGFLWLDRRRHMAVLLVIATISGVLMSLLLKGLFARPRPDVVPHLTNVQTSSFPSAHSMVSAVVYLTLGTLLAASVESRLLRVYALGVAVLLTLLVGASRVYLGVHYPTDVLAGWAAGLVWALLCWLIARRLQRRGDVEPPEAEHAK
jgi:undecaprenyl-diphosphatase